MRPRIGRPQSVFQIYFEQLEENIESVDNLSYYMRNAGEMDGPELSSLVRARHRRHGGRSQIYPIPKPYYALHWPQARRGSR